VDHEQIANTLIKALKPLRFKAPVTHIYNPLEYARTAYRTYTSRYGASPKEVVLLGMNPGPWGMAQTGIPFGEVAMVRDWLKIDVAVAQPPEMHPKRPVEGFACRRSEVSGRRLWGWARRRFHTPETFFERFFVANYCPLVFMEASGKNRTPNNLPVVERKPLVAACNEALVQTIDYLRPKFVIGIGNFAAERITAALPGSDAVIGKITHPSPANPKANKGWEALIEAELKEMGVL